ncbi:MAG: DNA topoisomerase VI subunit B [Candidatus Caldarchaeum sp.]
MEVSFKAISPSEFFYKNRDIAGFSSPSRSLYMSIRELVENSLDAAEAGRILPEIFVELVEEDGEKGFYRLKVVDNGVGVPGDKIPSAFATVLYGSKYGFKQSRGTFGLGGTMAILYGQITTNKPARVASSTDGKTMHVYELMIDVVENKPRVISSEKKQSPNGWRGTAVEFSLEADYTGSRAKILDYFKHTAVVNPHATLTFVDSRGRLYHYPRSVEKAPEPPTETLPHPVGVDVELITRLISETKSKTLISFMTSSFQKVGPTTAREVIQAAGLKPDESPKKLSHDEVSRLVNTLKTYGRFRAPDPTPLSPVGKEFLEAGIKKIFNPDFLYVVQREPSSYGGHPFIVEAAVAYGGNIPPSDTFQLYRFANKIPLLYDERADVAWKVAEEKVDWANYKVSRPAPLALFTSICSTKIPYKTVGKEAIADRPEIEKELTMALRECGRNLKLYLSRIEKREAAAKRLSMYTKYLPMIVEFSAKAAGLEKPDVKPLLKKLGIASEDLKDARKKSG